MNDEDRPGVIRRLGRELANVITGALDHADMPASAGPEEISFDQEARRHLAAIERKLPSAGGPRAQAEDPA